MLMTTLARSAGACSWAVVAAESQGVAMTMRSQSAAARLSPYCSSSVSSGHRSTRLSRASIARYFDREPRTTS